MLTPYLYIQMADTANLLPLLREIRQSDTIRSQHDLHFPVLVPNMKGLDTLLALEETNAEEGKSRLTDEIAVFVPASDVSRTALSLNTLYEESHA